MNEIERIEREDYGLIGIIEYDEHAGSDNPREWDNCWTIATVPMRNTIEIDEAIDPDRYYNFPKDYLAELREEIGEGGLIVPVFKYEHGLVKYTASDPGDPWDSGQVGVAYITATTIKEEWGEGYADPETGEFHDAEWWARRYLDGELETYTDWCNGTVYAYRIESEQELPADFLDSCGGFYDPDFWKGENGSYVYSELKSALDYAQEQIDKERAEKRYWEARDVETVG